MSVETSFSGARQINGYLDCAELTKADANGTV